MKPDSKTLAQHNIFWLTPDNASNIGFGLSTSAWCGVASPLTCAFRIVTSCSNPKGFRLEHVSGYCSPVMWMHQGSKGLTEYNGAVAGQVGDIYYNDLINRSCPVGFEAGTFGSGDIPQIYNSEKRLRWLSRFHQNDGETVLVGAIANGANVWHGMDGIDEEGVFVWQEDGTQLSFAEFNSTFSQDDNNLNGIQHSIEYRWEFRGLNDWHCDSLHKALCELLYQLS
ncbi:hypothetical protein PoB_006928800 [Plakobranchus ocellatus]|uniref:C-type lectin domain-containing protein n=1 Tax=Plakobranchus ocellatus TaxID=259542 RepID=A0AAV4DES6_9GAST|nr:hypothetical protein PoB_006928800 [Plakobranchus ocellatus]